MVRLFRNLTTEWLVLSNGLTVTPGHHFLNEHGAFEPIADLVARGGKIVLEDGSLLAVTAERIVYSEETRHLYEEAEEVVYAAQGGAALQPEIRRGWRTYNFEVEGLHTYIAGGVRVHNDSANLEALSAMLASDGIYSTIAYDDITAQYGMDIAAAISWGMDPYGALALQEAGLLDQVLGEKFGSYGISYVDEGYTYVDYAYEDYSFSEYAYDYEYADDVYVDDGYIDDGYEYGDYAEYGYSDYDYADYGYDAYGYDAYGYDAYGYDAYGYDAYGYSDYDGYDSYGDYDDGYDSYGDYDDGYDSYDSYGGYDDGYGGYDSYDGYDDGYDSYDGYGGYDDGYDSGYGGDYDGYGGYDDGYGGYDDGSEYGWPLLLDLNGDGVSITEKTSSNIFFDMAGDGYEHRTAWAGAGDGVLAIDADGDGKITERNEIIFTDWDPTADGDMQALRNVFDTNRNGLLDAGDARWSMFRVVVTNSDGTTSLKTLGELGIASINLTPNKANVVLPDGSAITGQTTYTRTDGTTGTVADATLSYDSEGHAVQQTVTHNADGSTTIDSKMLNPDGTLAGEITGVTSADGKTVTLSSDRDGDKVIDDVQTRVTVVNANGGKTETLSNATAAGRLIDRTVTNTSADGKTITIQRDANGDTFTDQSETRTTAVNGSSSIAISDLNRDGSVIRSATTAVSADGLSRTVQVDHNGDGVADDKETDVRVVNADGSRTETLSILNANGTLRSQSVKTLSSDGRTQTANLDLDGNGVTDLVQKTVITVAADGSSSSTGTERSRDNTLLKSVVSAVSANGLVRQAQTDLDGNGVVDLSVKDATVINADGSRTQTVEKRNADGSLQAKEVTIKGADGRSRTIQTDTDGDGKLDRVEVISVDASGASTATVSIYNANGLLQSKLVSTTSADGLYRVNQYDANGDGGRGDTTIADVTVKNADGSATRTKTITNMDESVRTRTIETVSANGLNQTTQVDLNGDGIYDTKVTSATVLNADGSKTQTITETNANGSVRAKETIQTSSDRQTVTVTCDTNGDGATDKVVSTATQANGNVVKTTTQSAANGAMIDKTVETTSANGFTKTVQKDLNGDGAYDLTSSSVTVLNADGSRTATVTDANGNGSLQDKTVTTVSATGLSTTTQQDINGDGVFDLKTTDATVLNADGSRTTTRTGTNADGSIRDRSVTEVSGNGLRMTIRNDVNGDGTTDIVTTDNTVLNADGSRTRIVTETNGSGTLRGSRVVTTSDDQRSISSSLDSDGDWAADLVEAIVTNANGDVVKTQSELAANGQLISKVVTTTSATGLSHAKKVDVNGDGMFDTTMSDVTALNADGSRTTTSSTTNANGSLRDKSISTVSATGLVRTAQIDADGNGTYETKINDTTVLNSDGSRTQTVTVTNASGTLRSKDIVTTSDDGETVSISHDLNGDGKIDQTVSKAIATNGNAVETRSNFNASGIQVSKTVETTSANNFAWSLQRDLDGNGVFDRVQARSTVLNTDGSRTTTFTDNAYAGVNGSVATLKSSVVSTVSDDGLSKSYLFDANSSSSFPNLFKRSATDVVTLNANGSRPETVSTYKNTSTLLDRSTTTVSGNGLSKTFQLDLDGNGSIDRMRVKTIATDGAVTESTELRGSGGTLLQKSLLTVSANGRSTQEQFDRNGDNAFDRTYTKQINGDHSVTETLANNGTAGLLKDKVVTTTSANGLSETVQVDSNGDGINDLVTTSVTTLNVDGSRTAVVSTTNATGALRSKTTLTTSDDNLTVSSVSDTNGDGVTDRTATSTTVLNANGSTTTTTVSRYADNSLRMKVVTNTSADERTTTTEIDSNGNGVKDKLITMVINADGTRTETTQRYSGTGVLEDTMTKTTSADGLTVTKEFSNGIVEKTEALADQNGSYTWTYSGGTGGQQGMHDQYSFDAFRGPITAHTDFGNNDGWSNQDTTPRDVADVNGDGRADIVGFGQSSVKVALGQADGTFGSAINAITGYTSNTGWTSQNAVPRKLGDVNGDGRADIVGFADGGVVLVALGQADGTFGGSMVASPKFVSATGWTSQDGKPREVADVNGDGRADLVGFGTTYVHVALGQADGTFGSSQAASSDFVRDTGWTDNDIYPRKLADVNGDGRADIVGFRVNGVHVALGRADGTFGARDVVLAAFGTETEPYSWASGRREVADVNGDGRADIVGFFDGVNDVYAAFGRADGTFSSPTYIINSPASEAGGDFKLPKLADVNGDGQADLVGFSDDGVRVALSGFSVSHAISLNGVDTWTSNEGGVVRTIQIDAEAKKTCLDLANRICGVIFDRQMTSYERETLLKYINDGVLDVVTFAADLMDPENKEFYQKYNPYSPPFNSNTEFVDRIYQNAFEHGATLADLFGFLTSLSNGTQTRAQLVVALAESAENLINGDEASAEDQSSRDNDFEVLHITDEALARNLVARIYDTMLDRAPTATESSSQAQAIVSGSKSVFQLISNLLTSSAFATKNGSGLSNAAFVSKMFLNAFGRAPTAQESQQWTSALDNQLLWREELILAIARTPGESVGAALSGGSDGNLLMATMPFESTDDSPESAGAEIRVVSGDGDELLTGSHGQDTFVFTSHSGHDVITAFQAGEGEGDILEFDGTTVVTVQQVLNQAHQQGADVVISLEQDSTITLKNIQLSALHVDNFRFI